MAALSFLPRVVIVDGNGADITTFGGGGSGGTVTQGPAGAAPWLITGTVINGAGSAAIGTVGVTSLPALVAGAAAIGTVGVTSLPALTTGGNTIGNVGLVAGAASIGTVVLGAGAAAVGTVALGAGAASVGTVGLNTGTNSIGTVLAGGFTTAVQLTPTVQAAAYAVNACVGTIQTIASAVRSAAGSGLIQNVTATFASGIVPSLDVIFFTATTTTSTVTDRVVVAITAADLGKVVGIAHLTDATLLGAASPSIMQPVQQLALSFKLPSGTSLFALVVTRTAVTLGATTDMILTTTIVQD